MYLVFMTFWFTLCIAHGVWIHDISSQIGIAVLLIMCDYMFYIELQWRSFLFGVMPTERWSERSQYVMYKLKYFGVIGSYHLFPMDLTQISHIQKSESPKNRDECLQLM